MHLAKRVNGGISHSPAFGELGEYLVLPNERVVCTSSETCQSRHDAQLWGSLWGASGSNEHRHY